MSTGRYRAFPERMVASMANYYATMSLAALSGETADVNVNTFAATGPSVFTGTEGAYWRDQVAAFYEDVKGLGGLKGRAGAGHLFKVYAATTTPPNYPIYESAWSFSTGSPGVIDLPLEVALCVSYANDSALVVPRARRRGRIYLSGWLSNANSQGRPTSSVYPALASAYRDYCESLDETTGWEACVWSRANASLYPIERVWCDNEWDTMRSRGGKSTARSTVTVLP